MSSKIIDKDLGWKRIKKQLKHMTGAKVAAGLFGNESKDPETNISFRGIVNEVGTDRAGKNKNTTIPSRPFTRQAFDKYQRSIEGTTKREYNKILTGVSTVDKMLNRLGVLHSDQIKRTITNGNFKANSPVTIALKGSSKPLIWNGEMRQAVTYEVRKK